MTADMKKLVVEEIEFKKRETLNLNGLVAFSLLLGGVLSTLRNQVKPLVEFSLCMEKVVIKMVRLFIWYIA
uniref:Uncharacterized protein n=1 Tax=Romanomermis culicivorax TaxID=13658 RepID=A0A915KEH7_ROMCU